MKKAQSKVDFLIYSLLTAVAVCWHCQRHLPRW